MAEAQEPDQSSSQVGAVIVSYFTGPLLWRCLDSVLAQPETKQVVVVDNGNWPGVAAELSRLAEAEPRLTILSGQGNVGFAAACNLGAAALDTPFLLILNPDARLPEGGIAALLTEGAKASPDKPFLIGGKLTDPDGTEQAGARRGPLTPWTAFVEMTQLYRIAPRHPYFSRFNNHRQPCPGKTVEMPVISGACMLMPKPAYEGLKGMDERYFLHVEDVDFCLRFGKAGGTVLYAPKVEIVHHKSSSRSNKAKVERLKAQSVNRYFDRHFKGVYPPGFLPLVGALIWCGAGLRGGKALAMRAAGAIRLGRRAGLKRTARALKLSRRAAGR